VSLPLPSVDATKDVWREWAKSARAEVDWEGTSAAIVEGLRHWLVPNHYLTVLVFLPMIHEVNLAQLIENDKVSRYVATRTPERDGDLSVHELGGPLEVHRFGFLQPHSSAPLVSPDEIDVALLPGLAFDLFGNRLGRGAGYFDRLLRATRPDAKHVGVVAAALVVDRLPADDHDIPVEYLATEEGVIETA
jgi:5-formyltetrahydrofolate cyclo-ligase